MLDTRRRMSAVFIATVLSLGALLVWYVLTFPLLTYLATRQARNSFYEQLTILKDGTPLLAMTRTDMTEYRDFEGEVVARGGSPNLGLPNPAADLPSSITAPISLPTKDLQQGRSLSHRILGLSDGIPATGQRETLWYFIRGPRNRGGAYFAGFDLRSGGLVGYLGAQGYQARRPMTEERFELGADFGIHQFATTQYASFGQIAHTHVSAYVQNGGPPEVVYLALPKKLIHIDLQRRTVRTFAGIADVVSIAPRPQPIAVSAGQPTNPNINIVNAGSPTAQAVAKEALLERLYVRTRDDVVVLDSDGNLLKKFPIPRAIQRDDLQVYRLSLDSAVMDGVRDYFDHHLFWVDLTGNVSRQEEVRLARRGDLFGENPVVGGLFAPGPLPIAVAVLMGVAQSQTYQLMSLSESLGNAVKQFAIPALFFLILSTCFAWFVYQREKRDGHRGIGWAVFVFLFGVFGMVGYLFHRVQAARVACDQCQTPVRRNRADCSFCGASFATPRRLGTEIFASE